MKTSLKKTDYSWCYISRPSSSYSRTQNVDHPRCTMCDEHYVNCPDDCMIDYD